VNYLLPGILVITIASGISYTAYRLFPGHAKRDLRAIPVHADRTVVVLWAHVLTSLVANLISVVVVVLVASLMGFRSGAACWPGSRSPAS
jgi:ABC-2 type transport system permease protein